MSSVREKAQGQLTTDPAMVIQRLKTAVELGIKNGERLRYFVEQFGNSVFSLSQSNGLVVAGEYLEGRTIFGPTFWVFDRICESFADATLEGVYLTPAVFRATELFSGYPTPYVRYLLSSIAYWEAQFYQHSSLQNPIWSWLPRKYTVLIGDSNVSDHLCELAEVFPYSIDRKSVV